MVGIHLEPAAERGQKFSAKVVKLVSAELDSVRVSARTLNGETRERNSFRTGQLKRLSI